jgi:hypothetical protein
MFAGLWYVGRVLGRALFTATPREAEANCSEDQQHDAGRLGNVGDRRVIEGIRWLV